MESPGRFLLLANGRRKVPLECLENSAVGFVDLFGPERGGAIPVGEGVSDRAASGGQFLAGRVSEDVEELDVDEERLVLPRKEGVDFGYRQVGWNLDGYIPSGGRKSRELGHPEAL